MAKLPLNIALNPFIQQRRQILGDRLLGAQGSVEGGGISIPRVGVTSMPSHMSGDVVYSGEFRGDPPFAPKPRPDFMDASPLLRGALRPLPRTITTPQPSQPQSMLAKIRSGLGASPTSPVGMAISSGAQSLLEQSGYSAVPRTTGEIVGKALGAAREGYMDGLALEQKAEQRAYEREKAERDFQYQRQQDQLNLLLKELEVNQKLKDSLRARQVAEFGNEKDLRKEFDTQSKDFTEARIGLEKVLTAGLDPNPTGASDVALVFGYMKVLDPNSVVREGEFATAENTAGVSGKIRTLYNRALEGQRLTPEQRENFVLVAKNLFEGQLEMQREREQNFINLANSYNLTSSQVVISRLPKEGSIINPREITDIKQADDFPKGSYVILNGRLGIVE